MKTVTSIITCGQTMRMATSTRISRVSRLLALMLLFGLPAAAQAQFKYTTNNGAITITGYTYVGGLFVTIPGSINGFPVTSIAESAFFGVGGMQSVSIPNSVTNIGDLAFGNCSSLSSVTISSNVISIGEGPFEDCPMLGAIPVNSNNPAYTSVGGVLFNQSRTALVQYPAGELGTSYTISNCMTIGNYAFDGCTLTSVTISNGLTSIGNGAFENCISLTNAMIPGSVTNIGEAPFEGCGSLTAINVAASNTSFVSVDGVLFNQSQTMLVEYPSGRVGASFTIPGSVTSIAFGAFSQCNLTSVNIPDSVTNIGDNAFFSCYSLASINIPSSITSIGNSEFAGSPNLTSINIPNSVTSIGENAFTGCSSLTNITIPSRVTSIGLGAFVECISLNGAYFMGNAPSANSDVFLVDSKATAYYLPGTSGWSSSIGGIRTAFWTLPYPVILNTVGVQTNQFGFVISWATNLSVEVEGCTNLANPVWSPVATNTLTGGTAYFSDPQWSNYQSRFYRICSP